MYVHSYIWIIVSSTSHFHSSITSPPPARLFKVFTSWSPQTRTTTWRTCGTCERKDALTHLQQQQHRVCDPPQKNKQNPSLAKVDINFQFRSHHDLRNSDQPKLNRRIKYLRRIAFYSVLLIDTCSAVLVPVCSVLCSPFSILRMFLFYFYFVICRQGFDSWLERTALTMPATNCHDSAIFPNSTR